MRKRRQRLPLLFLTLLVVGLTTLAVPDTADARHGRRVVLRPRIAPVGFYALGYGPYAHPWGYWAYGYRHPLRQQDRLHPALARALDLGALDLAVRPAKTEVWVDGDYLGTAGDFDGYPSYLWLDAGPHVVTLYKGGFETVRREVEIQPGVVGKLKLRLTAGDATPPADS